MHHLPGDLRRPLFQPVRHLGENLHLLNPERLMLSPLEEERASECAISIEDREPRERRINHVNTPIIIHVEGDREIKSPGRRPLPPTCPI
jgi:hypothetical protein